MSDDDSSSSSSRSSAEDSFDENLCALLTTWDGCSDSDYSYDSSSSSSEEEEDDDDIPDKNQLLIKATEAGDLSRVKDLLNEGTFVDANILGNGPTPLYEACDKGHLEIIKLLIKHGASIEAPNCRQGNRTPFYAAWDRDISDRDISDRDDWEILLELLIEHGADPNVKDHPDQHTPLHHACFYGYVHKAKFLIENAGADLNPKDYIGETPLHRCIYGKGELEAMKLLIENGADINAQNIAGNTSLLKACDFNRFETAALLVANHADVNLKNKNGRTPLWLTCHNGNLKLSKLLIENGGADVNMKDNDGKTPLHGVCEYQYAGRFVLETVKLLIENGANLHLQDNDGWSPLHFACWKGRLEVVQLLLSRGADLINMKTIQGSTPLDEACELERLDVVWFLVRQYPFLVLLDRAE